MWVVPIKSIHTFWLIPSAFWLQVLHCLRNLDWAQTCHYYDFCDRGLKGTRIREYLLTTSSIFKVRRDLSDFENWARLEAIVLVEVDFHSESLAYPCFVFLNAHLLVLRIWVQLVAIWLINEANLKNERSEVSRVDFEANIWVTQKSGGSSEMKWLFE